MRIYDEKQFSLLHLKILYAKKIKLMLFDHVFLCLQFNLAGIITLTQMFHTDTFMLRFMEFLYMLSSLLSALCIFKGLVDNDQSY